MCSMEMNALIEAFVGGVAIGLAAVLLLLWNGRIAGISGILAGVVRPQRGETIWRLAFLGGLAAGAGILAWFAPSTLVVRAPIGFPGIALAGLLVGVGTRVGNGCTSGHGVCGIGRLSPRSIVATITFMVSGALTVLLVHQ